MRTPPVFPQSRENTKYRNSFRFAYHLHCRGWLTLVVEISSRTPKCAIIPNRTDYSHATRTLIFQFSYFSNKTKFSYSILQHSTYLEKHVMRRKEWIHGIPMSFSVNDSSLSIHSIDFFQFLYHEIWVEFEPRLLWKCSTPRRIRTYALEEAKTSKTETSDTSDHQYFSPLKHKIYSFYISISHS